MVAHRLTMAAAAVVVLPDLMGLVKPAVTVHLVAAVAAAEVAVPMVVPALPVDQQAPAAAVMVVVVVMVTAVVAVVAVARQDLLRVVMGRMAAVGVVRERIRRPHWAALEECSLYGRRRPIALRRGHVVGLAAAVATLMDVRELAMAVAQAVLGRMVPPGRQGGRALSSLVTRHLLAAAVRSSKV